MGCLKAMVVRAGCAVMLVVGLIAAFIYREAIWDYAQQWKGSRGEVYVAPAPEGAAKARAALTRLEQRGGPAYEDLSAADIASLVESAMARGDRRPFDSVQVALLEDEIRVTGSLDLSGVPRNLLGPLSGAMRERERGAIGGPLSVDSSGHLVLTVTYLKLRDFPFPKGTIPRILAAAHVPGLEGARVPLPGTTTVGDVRVTPAYVRVYRSAQR
jgi:hypothetical protein